jgi:hypothetical protein
MRARKIVARGSWRYADSVSKPVFVVRLGFDFWYEMARDEGTLEADDEPCLDEHGHAYYVSFHGFRQNGSFWPDSGAHRSLDEAKAAAQSRVPSPISWRLRLRRR